MEKHKNLFMIRNVIEISDKLSKRLSEYGVNSDSGQIIQLVNRMFDSARSERDEKTDCFTEKQVVEHVSYQASNSIIQEIISFVIQVNLELRNADFFNPFQLTHEMVVDCGRKGHMDIDWMDEVFLRHAAGEEDEDNR